MVTVDYLAIDPADRVKIHRMGLKRCEEKIASLESEYAERGPTSWLARRQLPQKRKEREAIKRLIEQAEFEIMCTQYPEICAALTEEFSPREVRTRMLGNRQLLYVTARTVMNRLDSVMGPENWWDEYTPLQNGILCKLTLRFPDGNTVTKADAGGHAGMSDEGDDEKSGFSDAFKRAAVKFGIGRHLYGEGVPAYKPAPKPNNGKPKWETAAGPGESGVPAIPADYDGPRTIKDFYQFVKTLDPKGDNGVRNDLATWGREQGFPPLVKDWSDSQAIRGFIYLTPKLEVEAAK